MPPYSSSTTVILETDRLALSTWQASDWLAFRPIATDVEVMRYITGGLPWTDDHIRSFVNRQVELFSERGFCRWKLLLKPAREMVGFCGVGFWGDSLEPEIGWWLAQPHWGCGLATEAAHVALRDVFERTGWIESFPSRDRQISLPFESWKSLASNWNAISKKMACIWCGTRSPVR